MKVRYVVAATLVGGSAVLITAAPVRAEEKAPECARVVGTDGVAHLLDHPEIDIPKCTGRLVKLNKPVSAADKREADRKERAAQREADRKQRAAQREADRKQRAAQREADRKQRAAQREARRNLSLNINENGRYWS